MTVRDLSRRAVLAGACGTCAAAVASCATYTTGQAAPTDGAVAGIGASPTGGATAEGAPDTASGVLAAAADIPVGGGKVFADDDVVVTQPTRGQFVAFSATCTPGLHGDHDHREHDQLPVPRQQVRAGRRVGGERTGPHTTTQEDHSGRRGTDPAGVIRSTR